MMTTMKNLYEILESPRLHNPSLVVGWKTSDVGNIGETALYYLLDKLPVKKVAEIKPLVYSAMEGAEFKDDLIQVPESTFWASEENNLLFFLSNEPEYNSFHFLNLILTLSRETFGAKEIITIDGTPSEMSHLHPRRVLVVFNGEEAEKIFDISEGMMKMDWEGRPALSSYLIWAAKRVGLPGVSLWPEVPFYLAAGEDYRCVHTVLAVMARKFLLELDVSELNEKAQEQNQQLLQLKNSDREVDELLARLETGTHLDEQERMTLVQKVYEFLEGKGKII